MGLTTKSWNDAMIFTAGGVTAVASILIYRSFAARAVTKTISNTSRSPWSVGVNQPLPFKKSLGWRAYSAAQLKASGGAYSLLISTVIPRPIALISSQDANGALNCAPYSYFNVVCHDPPLVVIGMNIGRNGKKDTLNNVDQTGTIICVQRCEYMIVLR